MLRIMLVVLWALASTSALAQTPIVASNFDAGVPNYGCGLWAVGTKINQWYTHTIQPDASPSGHDAMRTTAIRTAEVGQSQWGCRWANSALGASPPQGAVRYMRWRIRFVGPQNWRTDSTATGESANSRTAPDKLAILGNLCDNGATNQSRMIFHLYALYPARNVLLFRFTQGTGQAGEICTGCDALPQWRYWPRASSATIVDTWHAVQTEIRSSTSDNYPSSPSADGHTRVWINNNTYASPDYQLANLRIRSNGWGNTCSGGNMGFGDFSFNSLSNEDATTRAVYDIADFEYAATFDPNWSGVSPGGSPPLPPTNLRLLTAWLGGVWNAFRGHTPEVP